MSWLKFETHTPEKPEVLAITIGMGWDDPDLTVGKLIKVWRWFDAHTVDGNATGVTLSLLNRLIGVSSFAENMVKVGWLIVTDDGLTLPNFENNNGASTKNRAATAKRVAKHKASRAVLPDNGEVTVDALPREEKIREEVIKGTNVPVCPQEKIDTLYHDKLSAWLPDIKVWSDARKKMLQARWKFLLTGKRADGSRFAETQEDGIEKFSKFFDLVAESDFLCGRADSTFIADIDFLLTPSKFIRIIEGFYSNKKNKPQGA